METCSHPAAPQQTYHKSGYNCRTDSPIARRFIRGTREPGESGRRVSPACAATSSRHLRAGPPDWHAKRQAESGQPSFDRAHLELVKAELETVPLTYISIRPVRRHIFTGYGAYTPWRARRAARWAGDEAAKTWSPQTLVTGSQVPRCGW